MPYDAVEWARALRRLLPQGRAWRFLAGSVFGELLRALAEEFARVETRAAKLLTERDVRTADELLPEWEALIDPPEGATLDQRRALLHLILALAGDPRPVGFVELAAALGFTVEVREYSSLRCGDPCGSPLGGPDWDYAWDLVHESFSETRLTCGDDCGLPLRTWTGEPLLFWLARFRPAHTLLRFAGE